MDNETRDTYIIPPNFIESGTLLGGMFRTRNVIEAGILALAVGLPILYLGLSLTTRIILLCLTALPLALLALIGVSGNSLSTFILLFAEQACSLQRRTCSYTKAHTSQLGQKTAASV